MRHKRLRLIVAAAVACVSGFAVLGSDPSPLAPMPLLSVLFYDNTGHHSWLLGVFWGVVSYVGGSGGEKALRGAFRTLCGVLACLSELYVVVVIVDDLQGALRDHGTVFVVLCCAAPLLVLASERVDAKGSGVDSGTRVRAHALRSYWLACWAFPFLGGSI